MQRQPVRQDFKASPICGVGATPNPYRGRKCWCALGRLPRGTLSPLPPLHSRKLLGGGQGRQEDGHTGNCGETGEGASGSDEGVTTGKAPDAVGGKADERDTRRERARARSLSSKLGHTVPFKKFSSTELAACFCQPIFG